MAKETKPQEPAKQEPKPIASELDHDEPTRQGEGGWCTPGTCKKCDARFTVLMQQRMAVDGPIMAMPAAMLLPGDTVAVLDRWVDAGELTVCAGVITGTNACDKGHYNVRILADPTHNDQDRDCLSVRCLVPGDAPRTDERYLIITREEAARRLFPESNPAKKVK